MNAKKETKQKKKSKGIFLLAVAIAGSVLATGLFVGLMKNSESLVGLYEPRVELIDSFSAQGKLYLVMRPGLFIGLFLFSVTIMIMGLRIFTGKSNPVKYEDPFIIGALNRILLNSLEQTVIFLLSYSYFVFFVCTQNQARKAYFLASLFVLARIIFLITYSVGVAVNVPSLRSVGFWMNVLVQTTLFAENLGIPAIQAIF